MSTFFLAANPPRSHLFMSHYSFNSPKQIHSRGILAHPFNHRVQIFLPTAYNPAIHTSLTESILHNTHYYHAHVPLSLFLSSVFMQHIRNGMIALSVQGGIDTHDVVCVDGKGKLILSLVKDSYEILGLAGTCSKFYPDRQRYVVELDLRSPSMIPGKPGFERIKWCFENTFTTIFSMVLASVDSNGVSFPLEFPETVKATQLHFNVRCSSLENIVIPDTASIRAIGKDEALWRKNVSELYEWIGMAAMQSDRIILGDKVDPFLCVYANPAQISNEPTASSGCLIEISGFVPSQCILQLFQSLRSLLDGESGPRWANISTWGFQDAPISWLGQEHGHLVSGENMYSFFLWSSSIPPVDQANPDNGVYVLLESVAAHDIHS